MADEATGTTPTRQRKPVALAPTDGFRKAQWEQAHIRWEIELFDSSNIPAQGCVFFCRGKSYLCYPSELVDEFFDRLSSVVSVLSKCVEHEPSGVLYASYCGAARPGRGPKLTAAWRQICR
ncbi:hypothetical protein [Paraburkholderia aspalathi]|uniref:hypothetical protein n=1 Tax=Paraburkholderia aspalathi TaxID=1324617 RepID=UPI0038B94491